MARLNSRVSRVEDYKTREFHSSDKPLAKSGFPGFERASSANPAEHRSRNRDHRFLLPQHGGGPSANADIRRRGWGKRAKIARHRNGASPLPNLPMLGEGISLGPPDA